MSDDLGRSLFGTVVRWCFTLAVAGTFVLLAIYKPKLAVTLGVIGLVLLVAIKLVGDMVWNEETGPEKGARLRSGK